MRIHYRPGTPADAQRCGEICYHAFKTISEHHNYPPDFPSAEVAVGLMSYLFSQPAIHSVVAEADGQAVGSNFLWKSESIGGVGPITIDPSTQNAGVGRALMEHVIEHAQAQKLAGVRLVQAAYHNRSLSLYTKLGFDAREALSTMQGAPLNLKIDGYAVRAATMVDVPACAALCRRIHGHVRSGELQDAIQQGSAMVVEHAGRITGYATGVGFFGHALGESNRELMALIGAAPAFPGTGFLLPTRNSELMRWCLNHGLAVVQPMTLMSMGLYNVPAGAFLPSILY